MLYKLLLRQKPMEKNFKFKYESSKKAEQAINRFQYYKQDIIPAYFGKITQNVSQNPPALCSTAGKNNIVYFWGRRNLEGEPLVNEESIIYSIKSTHLQKSNDRETVSKINQRSFQKLNKRYGGLMIPQWNASQVIQFVLKPGTPQKNLKFAFQLYIIHHCQNQPTDQKGKLLKWLFYVQKYSFNPQGIFYEVIASMNSQYSMFGLYSHQRMFQQFIRKYFKFQKFQGYLLQYQDSIKQRIKQSEDPAFNQQHKLIRQIPSQFFKSFQVLKKQFGQQNQQLICRFMIAKQFNLQQTRKSIQEYIEWKNNMTQKYKWEDFQEFHKMKIFYYLGQDYKGRPVVLNIAKNVLVDQMDAQKYCIYYLYFLEIEMVKKMRGYVTQLNIIADVQGIGNSNFKFSITKRNVQEGKKYCAERQFKFFAVRTSPFAYFCYRFIKPLLPKKTQQKVYIGGNDVNEILQNLKKDMSQQVIPTYLGGKNPLI